MEHLGPGGGATPSSFHCGTFNGWLLGVESAHATLDILVEQGGLARLEELGELVADVLRGVCADRGVPVQVTAAGGVFQLWFGDRPVPSAAGIRATDLAMSAAWHRLLLQAGVLSWRPRATSGLPTTRAMSRSWPVPPAGRSGSSYVTPRRRPVTSR